MYLEILRKCNEDNWGYENNPAIIAMSEVHKLFIGVCFVSEVQIAQSLTIVGGQIVTETNVALFVSTDCVKCFWWSLLLTVSSIYLGKSMLLYSGTVHPPFFIILTPLIQLYMSLSNDRWQMTKKYSVEHFCVGLFIFSNRQVAMVWH